MRRTAASSLFGLAPDGVYQAEQVALLAGGLLPHRFTLTFASVAASDWRFVFCGTFPDLTIGRRYRPSCPTEPGLSSRFLQSQRSSDQLSRTIVR
jgi:hypothetical protein